MNIQMKLFVICHWFFFSFFFNNDHSNSSSREGITNLHNVPNTLSNNQKYKKLPKRIKRNTANAHFENNLAGSTNSSGSGSNTSIGINPMNATQKLNKQQSTQSHANSAGKPLKMSTSSR